MNKQTGANPALVLTVGAVLWWSCAFYVYISGANAETMFYAISFILTLTCAMTFFRIFRISTCISLCLGWSICWGFLPEYSMSLNDRLNAFWNANRIGFGGITLMAISALLMGIFTNTAETMIRKRS